MADTIWVTDKIKADLKKLAEARKIHLEGLTCVLLRLAISNESLRAMAYHLIESCDLNHGATELEKRGW
ncbi:MAG: hypothetical protein LM601_07960 [Candidatus Verstraetearchaeota archaeon]|nr:hypothetical protein [Candidatus Verstraetearchaeota archaeon]